MIDTAQAAYARLDTSVAPTPPARRGDTRLREDSGHADAERCGAGLNIGNLGGDLHDPISVHSCTFVNAEMHDAVRRPARHNHFMQDLADEARAFIALAVEASGMKPGGLAKAAGVAPSTITRLLNNPDFKFVPKAATLLKIAKAANLELPASLNVPVGPPSGVTELPLLGPIQAGAFMQVDESDQDEPVRLSAALDPRYPNAAQWLREVRGESMNARHVFPGDYAHIVDWAATGLSFTTGQIVEVVRTRAGGLLREITLKEIEVTRESVLLWPRSTNPKFRDPVILGVPNEDIEVRVTGLLVHAIRRF